jgi:formamidopyrimidine-DNA glycosylase
VPELPEVECHRRTLQKWVVGSRIKTIECMKDSIVYEGVAPDIIEESLRGQLVLAASRHGKNIWLELENAPSLCLHLGMTGQVKFKGRTGFVLKTGFDRNDDCWPPRYTKLNCEMESGEKWAVTSVRRFGRILLRESPLTCEPLSSLGVDPLLAMPSAQRLANLLATRRSPIKSVLLNQKVIAGVGNWVADEVLYHARIDPWCKADHLQTQILQRLIEQLHYVIDEAIRVDADYRRFPKSWLFHRRWGKRCDVVYIDGQLVEFRKIGGRMTAWVPSIQRPCKQNTHRTC